LGRGNSIGLGQSPITFFPPLNFLLVAACLTLGSGGLMVPVLVMALLSWLSVLGTYFLTKTLFGQRAALLSALVSGIYPDFIFFGMTLHSENLGNFLLIFMFIAVVRYMQTLKTNQLLFAGILLAALSITRGGMHYFSVCIVLSIFVICRRTGLGFRLRAALIFMTVVYGSILLSSAVISPITGSMPLDSKNGIATVLHGTNRMVNPSADYGNVNQVFFVINTLHEPWPADQMIYNQKFMEMESWQVYLTIVRYIMNDPIAYLSSGLERLSFVWSPNQYFIYLVKHRLANFSPMGADVLAFGASLFYLVIVVTALAGLVKTRDVMVLPFLLFLAFNVVLIFISNGNSRYRLPLMPFFIIYSSAYLSGALSTPARLQRSLGKTLVALITAVMILNGIYRYSREIAISPAEEHVRKIEYCLQLGFPKTARHLLDTCPNFRYSPQMQKRLQDAYQALTGL
jgi:4-amino-4-deoxy-L-arabinose transferase-like glycosyltransferase